MENEKLKVEKEAENIIQMAKGKLKESDNIDNMEISDIESKYSFFKK